MLKLVPPRPTGITTSSNDLLRQKRFALAELLSGTEEMLALAQRGDWAAVEALEQTRKQDLNDFFRHNDQENSALLADVVATLMALNEQITAEVRKAKQQSGQEHSNLQNGKRAANNYLQIQDGV